MLIGRDRDVRRCLDTLSEGAALGILAEAGAGKTALLRGIAERRDGVLVGRCLASMATVPFLCLMSALGGSPFEDVGDLVTALVRATEGGALFLEDLQWADGASLGLLPSLVGRIPMLVTVRRDDPAAAAAIDSIEAAGFRLHRLRPLTEPESLSLLARKRTELSIVDRVTIVAQARGNPLLLEELSPGGRPSTALKVSVGARLDRLTPEAREAFALLAVAGRPMARVELEPAADELIASGLVVGPSDALLPRHELFAEVTLDRLPEQDRQRLHREVARRTDVPLVKAGHLAAAGEKQTAHRIALDTLAREDRSATRASLLVLAAQTSEPDEDDRLRIEAAEALVAAGAYDEALNLLPELHRGSWERGSWERTAEVLLVRAKALRGRDGPAAARGPLREAMRMARGSGAAIEIRLLLEEVEIRALEWEAPSVPLARRVLSLAEGTRFEPAAHHALGSTLFAAGRRGAIRHLRLAVDSARNTGDVVTMSNAALLLASSLKAAGWWRLSLRVAEAAREEADQHGLHGWATQLTFHRAYTLLDMTGDLETVITLGSDLISDPALPARLLDDAVGTVGLALVEAGRPVEARDVLHRTATRGRSAFRAIAEAELALETEPPTTAIATIDRLMVGLEDDPNTMILRVARAYACLAAGVQRPPDTQDGKLPFTRCYVEELAALHAFSVGDGEEAASRFDLAAAMARRHEIRAAIRCRWMAARSSALAGNLEEACKRLSSLEQETGASGMGRALGRIQGSLRELGVQRSAPRLSGYGPITGRERDVLEGVQAGRRSREIAIELGVSVATVETLIASAMRKLGAATRIQAAQRYAMIQAGSPPGGRGSTEVGTHPG